MRHVGTTAEVLRTFATSGAEIMSGAHGPTRTARARVPGGQRVTISRDAAGVIRLASYRTTIAEAHPDGRVLVGVARYSVTTSKLQGHLRAALAAVGYAPMTSGRLASINAAVPGRHGGYGIPWHPTGWEIVPAEVWTVGGTDIRCNRIAGHDGEHGAFLERDHALQVDGWRWCDHGRSPIAARSRAYDGAPVGMGILR